MLNTVATDHKTIEMTKTSIFKLLYLTYFPPTLQFFNCTFE